MSACGGVPLLLRCRPGVDCCLRFPALILKRLIAMGKTLKIKKIGNQRKTPEALRCSAFSAYNQVSGIAQLAQSESSELPAASGPGTSEDLEKSNSMLALSMKNKSVFPFRRSSRGRNKKSRKALDRIQVESGQSSRRPDTPLGPSPLTIASTSVGVPEKLTSFPFGKGKLRSSFYRSKKVTKPLALPRVYENQTVGGNFKNFDSPKRRYKSSVKSVELSTSRSLTAFEDDSDEMESKASLDENLDPNSNQLKKEKGHEDVDISMDRLRGSGSPALKRSKVVKDEGDTESVPETKSLQKALSVHSSPAHTVKGTTAHWSVQKAVSKMLKVPFPSGNSEEDGRLLFKWLIHPMAEDHFMRAVWEVKPAYIRRRTPTYVSGLFSTEEFNRILHESNVRYGVNLDVTSFQAGVRETHNSEGKVYPIVVWDNYKNGCSLRVKNPQAFSKPIWKLCATLQEYFKSMVGANIYLTPPGTQGFAPHYDDIEAFVLQLEGKKHWHLYNAKSSEETLPRYSSPNFTNDDIGNEIFDVVLEPGDLLYFPRGFIHQAQAVPDAHSLHITISTYQKNAWADVLEDLVPKALQRAIDEDVELRKGLPRDYLTTMGYQNRRTANPGRRKEILSKISNLFQKLADYVDVDENADERGKNFLHDSLPPALTQDERARTVLGATVGLTRLGQPGSCECDIDLDSKIRVIRKNALRLIKEEDDDAFFVYHCMQNPRSYHVEEPKYFATTKECAPVVEFLINSYPAYKAVRSIPLESDEDKLNVACGLFEKGILLLEDKVTLVGTKEEAVGTAV